ncbi:hypothetical protein DH2020_012067 [Rehmannia glutinosa]|uniref:Uncharacterized protein n=1 Tax=Rehmannia glutinosa TaxID=99300 RepID=A0ABR0XF52_REHGL
MGKTAKEEKQDGIEILSIGKLYTGPWDKKYWSSSRGKERYPYPIGYKSVRTQNGVTYTMEILEGLKGPSFMISSSDGKSCSGDTPDIAWERFQKKSCSKLWHGKRFSCKIDGVEFFGFKNTFVQRLLRELVANVGGTAEQSLSSSNISNGVCDTVQLQHKPSGPDPNLTYLVKSHVKGKRSKIEKVVNSKRLHGTNFKQHQQEKCIKNASSSCSKQRLQSRCGRDPSTLAAANEASGFYCSPRILGSENLAAIMENENCPQIAERGVQLDSVDISDHLKVGGSFPKKKENSLGDISRYVEVQEFNNLLPEETGGVTTVQRDMPVVNDADIYAPDTLDYFEESSSLSSLKNDVEVQPIVKDAIVKDVAKSEVLVTDSFPEDEIGTSANNTSSEKCHIDSVGQEIAKSMMTVLLPRAIPLLKTFTRKKKKTEKPSNFPTHRSQEENNMPNISMNDATIVRGLAEHSDVEKNEKACTACAGHDSVSSTSGNSDSVVPDSFDNDDPQPVLPRADAAKAGQFSCGFDPCAPLPTNVNAEANPLLCHSGIREHDINIHYERQTAFSDKPEIVAATSIVLPPVKEITPNSKRARLDCHSLDKLPPVHASTMQGTSRSKSMMCRSSSDICMPEKSEASFAKLHKDTDFPGCDNSSSKLQVPSTSDCCSLTENNEVNDDSRTNVQEKVKLNSKPEGLLELFACYVHPMPISMVQLIVKENEVFVCVTCGYSEHKESTIFFYKALKNGEKISCPSLIGHAPIALQISENNFGRDIAVGRSLLQLTPDGQSLVLLNSIITPYCREGKLNCSCPACTSDCSQKNAVKILRLNRGYASLVTRLDTTQGVCCLLVCESSFLLTAEEGGKLKLWVMNSGWSGKKEDCYLPTFDCMFPSIVELKTIPESATLVVGHNGSGEFGLCCPMEEYISANITLKHRTAHDVYSAVIMCIAFFTCLLLIHQFFNLYTKFFILSSSEINYSVCNFFGHNSSVFAFICYTMKIYVSLKNIDHVVKSKIGCKAAHFVLDLYSFVKQLCILRRDIEKRNLVSKFSSPGMSVLECIPASVFRWQRKGECKMEALVDEIMDATRTWFSRSSENHIFSPEDKNAAVWLLISTVSDPDSQSYQSCEQEANLGGCWRLALLVNNMVITGSVVDRGAAAVTSVGHGIIGRSDGLVYMWELSTGMKLENIHSFKGSRVSCITADTSSSGALAVASGSQLLSDSNITDWAWSFFASMIPSLQAMASAIAISNSFTSFLDSVDNLSIMITYDNSDAGSSRFNNRRVRVNLDSTSWWALPDRAQVTRLYRALRFLSRLIFIESFKGQCKTVLMTISAIDAVDMVRLGGSRSGEARQKKELQAQSQSA